MSGAHVEATEGKHAGYPCVATSGATEYDALLVSVPRGARPADYLLNNKFVTVFWTDARRNELVPSSSVRLKEPGAAEGRRPRRAAAGGRAVDPAGMARAGGARAAAGGNAAAKPAAQPAKAAAKGDAGGGKAGEDPPQKPAAKKSAAASKKRGLKSNDAGRNSKAPAKKDGKKKGRAAASSKSATAMEEVDLSLSDSDEEMSGIGARDVHKHGRFTGPTNALTFRRPAAASGENEGVFPPTIFTDANYTRGVLVPRPSSNDAGGVEEVTVAVPGDYFASGPGVHYAYGEGHGKKPLPSLTKDEALMWNHKNAAHAAAKRRFPMEAARLLGTITLHFDEKAKKGSPNALEDGGLLTLAREYDSRYSSSGNTKPNKDDVRFSRSVSKKQATGEALLEMGYPEDTKPEDLPVGVQTQLERRAAVIVQQWNNVKKQQPLKECWNKTDGGFVAKESLGSPDDEYAEGGYGEKHVAIECLRSWLEGDRPIWRKKVSVSVSDRQSGKRASLYGGLREVPTDAKSVLDSLLDLGHPAHLYKVPLITPYAVARVLKDARGTRTWRVRIGVYMNRLLPEILTATTLHIIMSALDEGSYIVKEPLHTPPMRDANNPVFKSARYPVVRLPGEPGGDQEVIELLDDDDMSCDEEKKEDTDVVNAAVIGCSRESSSISPFTPRGLLKLMENTGSDISAWPEIAAKLDPYLQLDLMLHQVHAICWMTQMESLGGYGINSMLWEEREFLDGGSIFYSPALGQIRLGRPPKTVGGCCADEMGLGKTLQMLSLIASSLDELKGEAKEGGSHHTHCTLIIVPPALAVQWCNEVKKCCGDSLKVAMLDVRNNEIDTNLVLSGGHGVDILVTTYAALDKPKTASYLASFAWGRIVLDEQQEIRSSTTKIAKNCEKLDCHRRWMLSGTPIFEGIEDLRGELNFLRLEPYAANWEDGFFDFSITNHWREHSQHGLDTLRILGLLILRRSKDMTVCRTGALIMEQKKLTIEFHPVEQTASERALYCFLEYIVAQQLNQKGGEDARDNKSTQMCLRLLRQLCFSAVMMNGGLGVPSQMRTLNTLMININRQMLSEKRSETLARDHESGRSRKKQERNRRLGTDDALRFLSQHQEQAKVSDGMVTNQMVGRGQGAANRSRASGAEVKLKEAKEEVEDATKKQARARKKRAKSYWHLALEGVTTGALADQHQALGVGKKFASLWRWRNSTQQLAAEASTNLPECLRRGWRPPADFAGVLQNSTNSAFAWTQPHAFRLDNIPTQVTAEEVARSVFEAAKKEPRVRSKIESLTKKLNTAKDEKVKARLQSEIDKATASLADAIARDSVLQRPVVVADPKSPSVPAETWGAYVQVQDGDVQTLLFRVADSKAGMALQSAEAVPRVESALKSAKEAFAFAESQSLVYPCAANNLLETDAKKALERAKLGLRIKGSNPSSAAAGDVLLSRALGALRGQAPDSASAMMESCQSTIESATNVVETASALLETGRRNIARLQRAVNHSEEVSKMSAFDTLEAIKEHRFDKTQCSICLCSFDTELESEKVPADPFISMTSCGHFYCLKCLDDYAHQCLREMAPFKCPNCRGSLNPSNDVLHIDHLENDDDEKKAMRNEAKEKVREASEMLKASDGAIADGSLWHALFLAIDVPTHVSNRGHGTFTAINREVLSHMRAATGMPIDCGRQAKPGVVDAALSSKVQALFRDLPVGEHAVVFASSKEGVLHIEAAMKAKSIVCFSLHVGQNTASSEDAVSKWQKSDLDSSKTGPVLIVQAGAAASGLTLTAAAKMFLMEPFLRQEEEQQAYARCHRYGQKKDVCVKIYYAPVSVESRLLSWRKKAAAKMAGAGSGAANVVYQELFDTDTFADDDDVDMLDEDFAMTEEGDDGEETGDAPTVEDANRTQFLLNLRPGRAAEDREDYSDCEEDDRKVSARRFILG